MDTGAVPWLSLPITVWLLWVFLCIVTFWHVLDYSPWFPFHCYIPKLSGQYRSSKSKYKELGAQSCPTLFVSVDCSPADPPVHGISQARILESVAISFSTGSSRPRDQTWVSCIAGGFQTLPSYSLISSKWLCKPTVSYALKALSSVFPGWYQCVACSLQAEAL